MIKLQTTPVPKDTRAIADTEKLEQLYNLREREEVLQFIARYPFLVPLLLEAPDKIRHYFPDTPLILAVDIDPETVAGSEDGELVLLIPSSIDPDESVDLLLQMDADWWGNVEARAKDKMFINLGY
ncbi:MAG: hypothetical protein F6J93_02825 [Oscillatoria sp. SIO1A7]|nr:hypothetical protein [Oscillatoria sp. SIO1A7]